VVFKQAPNGTYTVLYTFTGGSDGRWPLAGLIADSAGNLYGTTYSGGAGISSTSPGEGVVFKLAGTGFVTTTPFSAFQAVLAVELGKKPNTDAFELETKFSLGPASNGINPPAEAVSLQVGPFSATLPPGSFKDTGFGTFYFAGIVQGVHLGMGITPSGPGQYVFAAAALGANLSGLTKPVTVSLTLGDDAGTVATNPLIFHWDEKRHAFGLGRPGDGP